MYSQKDDNSSYTDLFITLSTKVELWLRRVIIVLLLAIIISQLLLQSAEIRYYFTTIGRLEGVGEEHIHGE